MTVRFTWTVVLGAVRCYGQWMEFGRAVLLPWWLAGAEHLGMSSFDPLEGPRTVHGGNAFTRLCPYLNSDISVHGPHQRSPPVTADELDSFANELRSEPRPLPFHEISKSALRAMLPHLSFNPGCGENATKEPTTLSAKCRSQREEFA